ncbi:MAG: alanine dehydrogenase [Acidobacteriota bacterium]
MAAEPHPVLVLARRDIESVMSFGDAIDAVEEAFREHGLGRATMPAKVYLDLPEYSGDFRAMPAYLPNLKVAGLKWVNSHPGNRSRGLPSVMAVMILSDPETALPLALLGATYLTLVRTGAGGGVAARKLARPDSWRLGLVGCGVQARAQTEALRRVLPLREAWLHDVRRETAEALAKDMRSWGITIHLAASARECVEAADVVVTATPARHPVVEAEWVKPGTHINAIGADAPGKQELESKLLTRARVIVDDREQAFHGGEVNVPLKEGLLLREQIHATLGEVVAGKKPGRENDEQITIFDSTGLAIQDLAVSRLAYDRCRERGLGTKVDLLGV